MDSLPESPFGLKPWKRNSPSLSLSLDNEMIRLDPVRYFHIDQSCYSVSILGFICIRKLRSCNYLDLGFEV